MNECEYINKTVKQKIKEIAERHEEILTAFIAKYGIEPNKIVQIYQDNTCYLVDIDNTHLCNSGKCYDLRNQLTSQVTKYQEQEIKQNDCDHIVGIDYLYSSKSCLIKQSDSITEINTVNRFNFCPECGSKLDE